MIQISVCNIYAFSKIEKLFVLNILHFHHFPTLLCSIYMDLFYLHQNNPTICKSMQISMHFSLTHKNYYSHLSKNLQFRHTRTLQSFIIDLSIFDTDSQCLFNMDLNINVVLYIIWTYCIKKFCTFIQKVKGVVRIFTLLN